MTEKYFVDSNLLIYRFDTAARKKQARAEEWLKHLWKLRAGALSIQVLRSLQRIAGG